LKIAFKPLVIWVSPPPISANPAQSGLNSQYSSLPTNCSTYKNDTTLLHSYIQLKIMANDVDFKKLLNND